MSSSSLFIVFLILLQLTSTVISSKWHLNLYLSRLRRGLDTDRTVLDCLGGNFDDDDMEAYIDYLLDNPNQFEKLWLGRNRLTDKSGIKLAELVARSHTIHTLSLANNLITEKTYVAIAAALHVNTSLKNLYLQCLKGDPWHKTYNITDRSLVEDRFVVALMINPHRWLDSEWIFYTRNKYENIFPILFHRAHPQFSHKTSRS